MPRLPFRHGKVNAAHDSPDEHSELYRGPSLTADHRDEQSTHPEYDDYFLRKANGSDLYLFAADSCRINYISDGWTDEQIVSRASSATGTIHDLSLPAGVVPMGATTATAACL